MDTRVKNIIGAILITGGVVFGITGIPNDNLSTFEGKEIITATAEDGVVTYGYKGAEIEGLLDPNEVIEKRNSSSYTIHQMGEVYALHAYSGDVFFFEKGLWYEQSYATTTESDFRDKIRTPFFGKALEVRAADFSAVGDGYIQYASSTSWDTAHDSTTGTGISTTATFFGVESYLSAGGDWVLSRAFLNFNTSSIPDGSTISYAQLDLFAQSPGESAGTRTVALVEFQGASSTVPSIADFDLFGAIDNPTEGAPRPPSITGLGDFMMRFKLDATGRGWIKDANDVSSCGTDVGITCLGIRTGWLDADDVSPVDATEELGMFVRSSENATAGNRPVLVVFYEEPCDPYSTRCTDIVANIGYNTWTAPTDVSVADVACWGAGGGGGIVAASAGGGGGGGAFASSTVSVTSGNVYGLEIGVGGAADVATEGGDSNFASTTVVADGGEGTISATGAAGGATTTSTGTIKFAGGNGGTGHTTGDVGGGGGGAGGPNGAGIDGESRTTTDTIGGAGGDGDNGSGGAGGAGGTSFAQPGFTAGSHLFGGGGGGGGDNSPGGMSGLWGGGGGGGETVGQITETHGYGAQGGCTITYMAVAPPGIKTGDPIIYFE